MSLESIKTDLTREAYGRMQRARVALDEARQRGGPRIVSGAEGFLASATAAYIRAVAGEFDAFTLAVRQAIEKEGRV